MYIDEIISFIKFRFNHLNLLGHIHEAMSLNSNLSGILHIMYRLFSPGRGIIQVWISTQPGRLTRTASGTLTETIGWVILVLIL